MDGNDGKVELDKVYLREIMPWLATTKKMDGIIGENGWQNWRKWMVTKKLDGDKENG